MDNTIDYNALLGDGEPSDPAQDPASDPTQQDPASDAGDTAPQLPDAGFDPNQAPPAGASIGEPSISAANQGQAGFSGTPPTGDPIVDDAIAKSQGIARNQTQPPPSEIAALNGKPGFSADGGLPSAAPSNPAPGPQLPNPGVGANSPATGGNDRFVRDASGNITGVRSENGYYDQNFQSVRNMEDNFQRGDRMAGTVEGLQLLANSGNQDAARILGAEKATGSNFMNSALEADWAKAHNTQIQDTLAGMTGKNANGASAANLQGQMAPVNAAPGTTAQDFPMAQKMMDNLDKVPGVVAGSVTMDKYGNVVFQDQSGTRHIPMNEWADWAPVIAGRANATTNNTTSTGGGAPPRGNASARGATASRGGSGGSDGTTPSTRTIFDSQAHRDAANAHVNNAAFGAQQSLVDSLFGSGDPNGGPPSGSYTPPAPGQSFADTAGNVFGDAAQVAAAGPRALGNAVGSAVGGAGDALFSPPLANQVGNAQFVSAANDAVNNGALNNPDISQWIDAARRKGFIP